MTQKLTMEQVEAVKRLIKKGDAIVTTGTTESGKSTADGFMAKGDAVGDLMSMREANGKGSTIETSIIVTDSDDISEDELIINARMTENHIATCSDDNVFLAKVLHPAVKKYADTQDVKVYADVVRQMILSEIEEPSNDSLAYKIMDLSENELNALVETFKLFPLERLVILLNEAKAKCEQNYAPRSRSKAERRIFRNLVSETPELLDAINGFWNCIISILNQLEEAIIKMLVEANAVISDDRCEFTVALYEEDFDSELANILLRSEDKSKEFLFTDMSIIYRGKDKFFEGQYSNYLTVTEQDGKEVHSIKLIDTMGLFHSTEVSPEDEAERIIDLVAKYHADKLLLFVNSHITDTVKNGYEAVKSMLKKMKRDVCIYVIFTHWDEYLKDVATKNTVDNRRRRGGVPVNWKQIYERATQQQEELIESFRDSLKANTNKVVPHIIETYKAAILIEDSASDIVLREEGVEYETALNNFVQHVLVTTFQKGPKIRVKEGMLDGCIIKPNGLSFDIRNLYRNMVVDCKGHKYWASSVRAVNRKWCFEGMKHDSDIAENEYGFMNIHSNFVIDMRNLAMNILNNTDGVSIEVEDYVISEDDKKDIRSKIIQYLKDGQAFGKEFAKIVGNEAFEKGFKSNENFCYQYQRFTDMIQYTQDQYFTAEKVTLSENAVGFVSCLQTALHRCITDFLNAKCIEVYQDIAMRGP